MRLRSKLVGAALGGLLATAATASAATVSIHYTTTFDFSAAPGVQSTASPASDPTATFHLDGGAYSDSADWQVPLSPNIDLGTISLTGSSPTGQHDVDLPFVLTISQSVPSSGSGDITTAKVDGTVSSKGGFTSISLAGGNAVRVGNILYTLPEQDFDQLKFGGTGLTVQGTAQYVPVPAAVWGGVSLLGVLGGGKLWRRRREIA